MNALAQPVQATPSSPSVPMLRTLVLCDLVDSTALVQRLGDQRGAELLRRHDRLARALISAHGGREIDKTDGFLLMFERPVQAVGFALAYLRTLRELNLQEGTAIAVRVGIHVGDILSWDNTPDDIAKGAKPIEVEGLVKPITSRLMQLALPNQILLSGVAHALAHRAQGELGAQLEQVRWRTHGRYRFKGIPDPIPVFEVGEEGTAPLKAPPWSGKAHREVPFWRRPATLGIELAVLFVLLAVPAWYLLKPEPAIAFAQRDWVVVGDLKNLTGQTAFDDSLETAFRIGLEQSRYVNVLSDLKTRETIKRMQRDPDSTEVDRTVGSEIALRDGARALILPTIAEIGGRVRITAEVIDPHTQTTVYSESADGVGEASVLPSLDQVNQKLRVRLGEALATVSKESMPLEKVTTTSLDALKAYSIGEETYAKGDMAQADSLYKQALDLDPAFALAHVARARVAMNLDRTADARRELSAALAAGPRLQPRDKLYAEAMQATFADPLLALEKLRLLTTLYPGRYEGIYGYFTWQEANRFEDAIDSLKASITTQNPYRGTSEYILGVLYLGTERYDEAIRKFAEAKASGLSTRNEFPSLAYAAKRDYGNARRLLDEGEAFGPSAGTVGVDLTALSLELDQGRLSDAMRRMDRARDDAATLDADGKHLLQVIVQVADMLSMRERVPHAASPTPKRVPADMQVASVEARFEALFSAYAQAHAGNAAAARALLDGTATPSLDGKRPVLSNLRVVAEAEVARVTGDAKTAADKLRRLLDGNELFITHVALLDAYSDLADHAAALEQARWLSGRRGRAFAEYNVRRALTPFNVAQANLAKLRVAELLSTLGRKDEARAALAEFRRTWPGEGGSPALERRARELEARP